MQKGVCFVLLGVMALTAGGSVIITHSGGNDPLTQGWSSGGWRQTETLEGTVVTNWVAESGSETIGGTTWDYWRVLDRGAQTVGETTGQGGAQLYRRVLDKDTHLSDPLGWTLTVITRVVDEGNKALAGYYAGVNDGENRYAIHFWEDRITYWNATGGQTTLFDNIDTTDDYHTYRMVYDPAGDSGAGAVNVFMDDVFRGTITATMAPSTAITNVFFASGSSSGSSEQHWNLVTFNSIPEPGTVLLLGAFLGAAWLRRRSMRGAAFRGRE